MPFYISPGRRAGAVLHGAGAPVMAVSGFIWDRLLKPAQQRMHFFQDFAPSVERGAVQHSAAAVEQQASVYLQASPHLQHFFARRRLARPSSPGGPAHRCWAH